MTEVLNAFGNDPRTLAACQRALKLHHRIRTGPLPYETVLAIAAITSLDEAWPEDEWPPDAELPQATEDTPKKVKRG